MHVLITGGAGFIGSHYARHLLRERSPGDLTVTVLDNLTYAGTLENLQPVLDDPRFHFHCGDITDPALLDRLLPGVDAVVHFAAESHVDRSIADGTAFVRTNVLGTHCLLEATLRNGVSTFVHISTDEIYGSIESGMWSEDDPVRPNSPYSASKASSDLLVLAYHHTHALDVRITRCSNNYGPRQHPEKVIPLFITNLLEGRKIPIYGDGMNMRDWLHVEDHCRAIDLVLTAGRPGEIYNIGGGTEMTNRELAELLVAACDGDLSAIEHTADRKGHDRRYCVDWSKARTELGYQPTHDFETGLARTVKWYQENPQWWRPLKTQNAG